MKFIIFEQLSCLAHIQHNTQPSNFWLLLQIIIMSGQYISILLPYNGWNIWTYIDDNFQLIQQIFQLTLIIPYTFESVIDFRAFIFAISICTIIIMILIIALLFFFGIIDNNDPQQHISLRRLCFNVIIQITTVFQLPILMLYLSQIIIDTNNLNQNKTIFNSQSIINFFAILLFTFFVIIQQYFLRAYSFVPFNFYQSKFYGFQLIQYLMNVLICTLYILNKENIAQYALLAFLHLTLLLRIIEIILARPYIPIINTFNFAFIVSVECLNIIISINIFSNNQIFQESQLIFYFFLIGLPTFYVGYQFIERKSTQTFSREINQLTCISYTQEMHFKYNNTIRNSFKSKEFFQLFLYWKAHKITCDKHWLKPNSKQQQQNQISKTHQTIFCILSTELDKAKIEAKIDYEELQLLYISYVATFCKKPLLAYVELKRYQSVIQQQSYYFISIRYQLSLYLQNLIKKQQLETSQHHKIIAEQERQLDIKDIFKTLQFQEEFLPQLFELLNQKIQFWTQQTKGFNNIYDLEKLALKQTQKIKTFSKKLKQYCNFDVLNIEHLSISTNVQDLKLLSIFCSAIMNDYYSTQICESTITEIYNIEHTLSEDIITNLSFIQERAVIILMSMVKQRGKIVNEDKKQIAQFFNYTEQEFLQIENISELMPSFFGQKHDKLLINYLQTAKSIFFDDYSIIFGQSRDQMLIPYQLKLDNNFKIVDDYVLIGCLSIIKQSSDFILFGEDGFLIGVTDNFYKLFINHSETSYSKDNIGQLSIFAFFPNIMDILQEIKNNYGKDTLSVQQDKYFKIFKFLNIKDVQDIANKLQVSFRLYQSINNDSSLQRSKTSYASIDMDKTNKTIYNQLGQISNLQDKTLKITSFLQQLPIFSPAYINQMMNFIQTLELRNKQFYQGKLNLQFKVIGKKEQRKGYFILEISDIRKTDETRTTESLMNNLYSQSIQTTNKLNKFEECESNVETLNISKEEAPPHIQRYTQPAFQKLLQRLENPKPQIQVQQYQDMIGQDSARDSMSYGPLSQRINFISPSSKQQHLQELIEKDFTDLQHQLDIEPDEYNDLDIPDQSQVKSSSREKKEQSNNIIEILQKNKQNIDNHKIEDRDIDARKSKSSVTSGTSGISAIFTIKQFQQKTAMTSSLKMLFLINLFVLIMLTSYLIIHIILLQNYNDEILATLNNISGPMLFNRYFCKLFTYSWSLVFNTLDIIASSEFILTQTVVSLKELSEIMFSSLNNMYNIFIGVEVQGYLNLITLDLLYQDAENVTYTYFINLISNVADGLFEALNYKVSELDEIVDRTYLDNLLTLRYNLKNVVSMNSQLIDSLNVLFNQQQDKQLSDYQLQIILEIIFLFVVIFYQLYYWKQIENYCQQIVLLVGKLQFSQAQEMITRFTALLETLKQISGKKSWKQQNYYKLMYFPLNQIGIEGLQTQSKILKDYQLTLQGKSNLNLNPIFDDGQRRNKKNLNVALNSRINTTATNIISATILISITFSIFLVYLLGGYLFYKQQQVQLSPTQQLSLSFIRFTSQLDTVISTALITKSQSLLYDKLVAVDVYTDEEINSFRDQRMIIKIFLEYYSTYYENLTEIYQNIVNSDKINSEDEQTLLSLYQESFCILLSSEIPFCNDQSDFNTRYGTPSYKDNNSLYLSQGIQGVVSRLDLLFKQNFQYEINNVDYDPNDTLTLQFFESQEFSNAIWEHFLDTTDGTNAFIDKLFIIIGYVMDSDLSLIKTYYFATGISLQVLFIIIFGIWIYRTNQRLILLRLILTNLPIEILTEQHTLSSLKKLK